MTTLREAVRRRIVELVPDAETQKHTWPEADGSLGYAETDKPIQLHDVLRAIEKVSRRDYAYSPGYGVIILNLPDAFIPEPPVFWNLAVDADGQPEAVWQWLAEVLGVTDAENT
jgi:hypothetical protein